MTEKSVGNLFVNDYRKSDKQPEFTGYLEITREQIEKLIEMGKAGKETKLKLGMWRYPSKRNPNESRIFISAEAGEYQKKSGGGSGWDNTPF